MSRYNYYYFGAAIPKSQFIDNVPSDWEDDYDELKGYSWGGYRANKLEL